MVRPRRLEGLTEERVQTLRDKCIPNSVTGCLEYRRPRDKDGYGRFKLKTKKGWASFSAHRVMYVATYGEPEDPYALIGHTCDNPPCCNPDHLVIRNHMTNQRDAEERGRGSRGSQHPGSKLTDEKVKEMVEKYIWRKATQRSLAEEYGVCPGVVHRILGGFRWTHITGGEPVTRMDPCMFISQDIAYKMRRRSTAQARRISKAIMPCWGFIVRARSYLSLRNSEIPEFVALRASGMSLRLMGMRYGVSHETIRDWLRKIGKYADPRVRFRDVFKIDS